MIYRTNPRLADQEEFGHQVTPNHVTVDVYDDEFWVLYGPDGEELSSVPVKPFLGYRVR